MPLPRKVYLQRYPIVIITINVMKQYPIWSNDSVMLLVPSFSNAVADWGVNVDSSIEKEARPWTLGPGPLKNSWHLWPEAENFQLDACSSSSFFFCRNTSTIWIPASDRLPMVFRNCRGKWEAKRAWNSSNSNCFVSMVRDKVVLKKSGLDFWKVGVSARAKKFKAWGHVESLRLRWGMTLNSDLCNLFICCL